MGKALAHVFPRMVRPEMVKIFATVLLWLLALGCSTPQYFYTPAEKQAEGKDRTEAVISDPLGLHSGVVRVQSVDISKLKLLNQNKEISALHMRIAISNETSDQTWVLNAQDQSVSFPNHARTFPVAVNSDHDGLPRIKIPPGELRSLDLFFPLPGPEMGAKDIPDFDMNWSFSSGSSRSSGKSGGTRVAQSVPFNRQRVPEVPVMAYPAYGVYAGGPYWWYRPGPYF